MCRTCIDAAPNWFFFFQAEDGIRDGRVTGVQTCALPIFIRRPVLAIVVNLAILIAGLQSIRSLSVRQYPRSDIAVVQEIGRASCRERAGIPVVAAVVTRTRARLSPVATVQRSSDRRKHIR